MNARRVRHPVVHLIYGPLTTGPKHPLTHATLNGQVHRFSSADSSP